MSSSAARRRATIARTTSEPSRSSGSQFSSGPVREFQLPIFWLATGRERGEQPDFRPRLCMRGALKVAALQPSFIEQLADAQTAVWKICPRHPASPVLLV